jgi:hypothetical protein
VCETGGFGDPVVLYDQIANRWLLSEFAGTGGVATDECIAISTTSDATGSYNRYGFHLGSNFFDYPHLGVWPDGYYMSDNVFNSAGTAWLGIQPFVFNRAAMLTGAAATFQTTGLIATSVGYMLPADLDGSILPPAGAPNPFLGVQGTSWPLYRFHVDWATPANTTFTTSNSLTASAFTALCPSTRACVPESGGGTIDGIGDRPMFRSAYRRFADGHEALVGNRTVSSSGVAGIRWWEVNNATSGVPTFVQQSTYQPDTTWRWMGSAAMDTQGNLAMGFSASSSAIFPQLRYAGRLAGDPASTLAQGENTLFAGTGSQTGTGNRWGDYSDLTIDPVDDCTFWYTNEYYAATGTFNWRTRIGSFKFPGCTLATVTPTPTGTLPTATNTPTITLTPTATQTPCGTTLLTEGFESGTLNTFASSVATCVPGNCGWSAANTGPHTGTFSAFVGDPANITDQRLELTTALAIPANATAINLSFWHKFTLENTFDGGVLETSIDGGTTWVDVGAANITTGTYNGTISTSFGSPIGGRQAWTGTQAAYGQVIASLPVATFAGQNLRFRFRMASDSSVAGTGWWVDDISVGVLVPCGGATSTATRTATVTQTGVPNTATVTQTGVANTATVTRTSTATSVANTATSTATGVANTATSTATGVANTSTPTRTATVTRTPCSISFSDVTDPTAYYYAPVLYLACHGVIGGYSDGTFRPFNNTTRGQMAKIVVGAFGLAIQTPAAGGHTFADVPVGSTFFSYVETAAANGIIGGYPCGGVNPQNGLTETCDGANRPYYRDGNYVTRGQLSKIVVIAAMQVNSWTLVNPPTASFSDVPVGSTFYQYIETAVCHGAVGGYADGTFQPSANAFRGQIAKIVYFAIGSGAACGPAATPPAVR